MSLRGDGMRDEDGEGVGPGVTLGSASSVPALREQGTHRHLTSLYDITVQ